MERIVLAYSGGLDTSVAVRWLADKYDAEIRGTYNFRRDEFQTFTALFEREFPNLTLGVLIRHDNVQGETSFGFQISPLGGGRSSSYLSPSRGLGG